MHNALNLEAKANCWANTETRRTEQNRREPNKKLKWTYQKVVKMSLLNTSMFILLLLLVPEYLFICALRTLLWVPLCNFSHSRRSRWQCESNELWTLMGEQTLGQALLLLPMGIEGGLDWKQWKWIYMSSNFIICEIFYTNLLLVVIVDWLMSFSLTINHTLPQTESVPQTPLGTVQRTAKRVKRKTQM